MVRIALMPLTIGVALLAAPAFAQDARNIPSGSPLGAGTPVVVPEQVQAEAQAQARAQAQAAARAQAGMRAAMEAALAPPTRTASVDPGRPRDTSDAFGQTFGDSAARPAPSPYGGYYKIRTPWDPQ